MAAKPAKAKPARRRARKVRTAVLALFFYKSRHPSPNFLSSAIFVSGHIDIETVSLSLSSLILRSFILNSKSRLSHISLAVSSSSSSDASSSESSESSESEADAVPAQPAAKKAKLSKNAAAPTTTTTTHPTSSKHTAPASPSPPSSPSSSAASSSQPNPHATAFSQPTSTASAAAAFPSWYLRRVTRELAEDLDGVRSAADFGDAALPLLVHALQQGEAVFDAGEKVRFVRASAETEKL
ncbi:hypothetical protein HDK90DRAFT_462356 [Phyllosticta capitalensis]|uniref:Ribosome assembly protein 3 n=1 Tax=Phyllosticta capitalensis TaxID=121624 RepID=A0ABR1YXM7_9PEZI